MYSDFKEPASRSYTRYGEPRALTEWSLWSLWERRWNVRGVQVWVEGFRTSRSEVEASRLWEVTLRVVRVG